MKKSPIILIVILMLFFLLSWDNKISHKEHDWKDRKVTKEATCTEDGEAIVSCSCGETKTIILEKLGHDIKEIITEPTPLKKGRIDYNCSRCEVTGLKESVELDRSIAGYGMESYDSETREYHYYKFEENGILYSFHSTFTEGCDAYILYAVPQIYKLIESEEKVKLYISYKNSSQGGMFHDLKENDGTISTTYKSSSYPQEEKKTLVLTKNTNLADLPTQIILNNNDNKQNQEDREKYNIDWDAESTDSVCIYAYWDNEFLKKNSLKESIFVCFSSHVDVAGSQGFQCTVCGRVNNNNN